MFGTGKPFLQLRRKYIMQTDSHDGDLRLDNILVADSGLTIIIRECVMIKTQKKGNIHSFNLSSTDVDGKSRVL